MYTVPNKQVNFQGIVWDSPIIILRYPQTPLPQESLPKLLQLCGVFLRHLCIKSCTLVITFNLTNSPGLVFFGPKVPPGLLSI